MSSTRLKPLHLVFPLLLTGLLAHGQQEDQYCPKLDGRAPPELRIAPDGWVNVEGELTLENLRGRVVWLEFSFIACGGCRMMKPFLHGLQHEFGASGLVVVEVNNGAVDTREALVEKVQGRQPNHAVLWDAKGATCEAYGIRQYGTAYLIGADGKVIWGGNPILLTVNELWSRVASAVRGVDPELLARADRPFQVTTGGAAEAAPPPREKNRAYDLGYQFSICTDDNSMVIDGVRPGSPADHGGFKKGDVVLSIDNIVLSKVPFDVLKSKLHELEEGPRTVKFSVEREGEAVGLVIEPPREPGG